MPRRDRVRIARASASRAAGYSTRGVERRWHPFGQRLPQVSRRFCRWTSALSKQVKPSVTVCATVGRRSIAIRADSDGIEFMKGGKGRLSWDEVGDASKLAALIDLGSAKKRELEQLREMISFLHVARRGLPM